jgi:TonB family protein
MNRILLRMALAGFAAGLVVAPSSGQVLTERPSSAPLPAGQAISAKDGDTVVVDRGVRIRVVRRTEANARVLFSASERSVVLLVDFKGPAATQPDGNVDATYFFSNVAGAWPLGERWEGSLVIDEYSLLGAGSQAGIGLRIPGGVVLLLSTMEAVADAFADASALATLTYAGSGSSGGGLGPFDAAEQRTVAEAKAHAKTFGSQPARDPDVTSGNAAVRRSPRGLAPVRVGGNIAPPEKIHDVRATMPAAAAQAGLTGVVILEIIIGADGSVADAKVLRSIPLLDQPALDAVRQWRYTPTLLNATAVPVIMTVTVDFRQ